MSQEGINPGITAPVGDVNIAHELMEEDLQREIARNQAANKMAMERELAALAARKRAEESQVMMQAMLSKYEEMRDKLDSTKKHLDETNSKLTEQEKLTDKISQMKERVEAYANKKKAVNYLQDHVTLKMEVVDEEGNETKKDNDSSQQKSLTDSETTIKSYTERVDKLKVSMAENEAREQKREELKKSLEKAIELGEKRAAEQNRITAAREKMLELKLKELELQKAKLARKKREQEAREKATTDFCVMIDKQLEDMENKVINGQSELTATGAVPKHPQSKGKGKGKKNKVNTPNTISTKVLSPEPSEIQKQEKTKTKKSGKSCDNNDVTAVYKQISEKTDKTDNEKTEAQANALEQIEKVNNGIELASSTGLTEEEIRATVDKIEGKVQNVRGNIADIAMSEQYLRTKQAMLMAKKKEQERKIAENIADIREAEVIKMKEKVKHMQELLHQRKEKLKATEEIMNAKNEEKKAIDKIIQKAARRENYLEKEIVDRVVFEKEPPKED